MTDTKQMKIYIDSHRKRIIDELAKHKNLSSNQLVNLILDEWVERESERLVIDLFRNNLLVLKAGEHE